MEKIKRSSRISVYGAFDIKDSLKALGFRWNGKDKTWEKDFDGNSEEIVKKVEDIISESGKNIRYDLYEPSSFDAPATLPDKWCDHEFTKEEKEALLAGNRIWVDKCWSKKKVIFFSCYLKWDGEELIASYGDEE